MDRKKLALIHIIKKELGLNDEEYRGILRAATGVESAKDLDEEKFRKLMKYFVRSRHYRLNPQGLTIRQKLFIDYLVNSVGWSTEHFSNFLHKYYGKTESRKLTKKEAIKVIVALKNISAHQK